MDEMRGSQERLWARAAADDLLVASDIPVDLESIAQVRRVRDIVPAVIEADGLLIPTDDGFVIKVPSELRSHRRRRWTVAHELAHTLFFDLDSTPPRRRWPAGLGSHNEESVCNLVAEYLLMPSDHLERAAAAEPPSLSSLIRISQQFQVSVEAAARALVGRSLWNVLVLQVARTRGSREDSYRLDWGLESLKTIQYSERLFPNRRISSGCVQLARCLAGRSSLDEGSLEFTIGRVRLRARLAYFAAVASVQRQRTSGQATDTQSHALVLVPDHDVELLNGEIGTDQADVGQTPLRI